jgi:hypothetical protein
MRMAHAGASLTKVFLFGPVVRSPSHTRVPTTFEVCTLPVTRFNAPASFLAVEEETALVEIYAQVMGANSVF